MLKLILIESGTSHGIKQFYIIDISINLYRRETMAKRKSIFRRIKEAFVNFFGNIRFYKGGVILFGDSKYKLKGTDWRSILDSLQPGDIVGSAHNNYISAWFIKGDFGHVGVYVGDNRIIHVRTDGIANEDILTFLRADNTFVVRVTDQSLVEGAIKKAYEQLAKDIEYDYDFDKQDTEQFYCSEFTDFCYNYPLRGGVSKDKTFIYPDDYLIPSDLFDIIWTKQ
jgi:hypothetical protein